MHQPAPLSGSALCSSYRGSIVSWQPAAGSSSLGLRTCPGAGLHSGSPPPGADEGRVKNVPSSRFTTGQFSQTSLAPECRRVSLGFASQCRRSRSPSIQSWFWRNHVTATWFIKKFCYPLKPCILLKTIFKGYVQTSRTFLTVKRVNTTRHTSMADKKGHVAVSSKPYTSLRASAALTAMKTSLSLLNKRFSVIELNIYLQPSNC